MLCFSSTLCSGSSQWRRVTAPCLSSVTQTRQASCILDCEIPQSCSFARRSNLKSFQFVSFPATLSSVVTYLVVTHPLAFSHSINMLFEWPIIAPDHSFWGVILKNMQVLHGSADIWRLEAAESGQPKSALQAERQFDADTLLVM